MKKEIFILCAEFSTLTFDNGKVRDMTRIDYAIKMLEDTDTFVGMSTLFSFVGADAFNKVIKFIGQKVQAEIIQVPTKNGCKYVIKKINDITI